MYHPVVARIKKILTENKFWFETFEHEPVRTSEEAAKIRSGYSLSQGAKALILRVRARSEKKYVMLVVPGDAKFDKKKIQKVLGAKDIRFATQEEIHDLTGGVEVGGIPPFGNLFGLKVIIDPSVLTNEKIIFNAGDRRYSIAMKTQDYENLVNPLIEKII